MSHLKFYTLIQPTNASFCILHFAQRSLTRDALGNKIVELQYSKRPVNPHHWPIFCRLLESYPDLRPHALR